MKKQTSEFGKYVRKLRVDRELNETEVAKKAGLSQATISGWEREEGVTPNYQSLVDYFRSFDLKWPESIGFFAAVLKRFNGKMAFQINDGIVPKDLLITFLASYLAADCTFGDRDKQLKVVMGCIDNMKQHLEHLNTTEETPNHVTIKPDAFWPSPLPPKSENPSKK